MSALGQSAFVNEQLLVAADKPDMSNLAGALIVTDPV